MHGRMMILALCLVGIFGVSARFPNKVVGGERAEFGEFPHQVSIRDLGAHICGGAIISSTHILTAAHCFVDGSDGSPHPSDLGVIIGVTDHNSRLAKEYKVLKYECHEGYTTKNSDRHDIALITLREPIVFSESVQPIALPKGNSPEGTAVVASGWGSIDWNNGKPKFPKQLKKVDLKVIGNNACQKSHKTKIYPEQICVFEAKGKGVCVGDSGGPIIANDGGSIISIVSWGQPCAKGVADVGTRVWSYLSWIHDAMNSKAEQKKYGLGKARAAERVNSSGEQSRCRYFQC